MKTKDELVKEVYENTKNIVLDHYFKLIMNDGEGGTFVQKKIFSGLADEEKKDMKEMLHVLFDETVANSFSSIEDVDNDGKNITVFINGEKASSVGETFFEVLEKTGSPLFK